MNDFQTAKQILNASTEQFENIDALYREGQRLFIVRLSNIKIDKRGVSAKVTPIRNLVDDDYFLEPWEISIAWGWFSIINDEWGAAYVGWHIQFDRNLVNMAIKQSERYKNKDASKRRVLILLGIIDQEMYSHQTISQKINRRILKLLSYIYAI